MGTGPDVLLLHGLGGTRASLFDTAAALSRRYRVHAPDLPGFGSSSKPALGGYNARWFADIMLGLMDELGIADAHVVGNSMGGRIAIEMGLVAPDRVRGPGPAVPGGGLDSSRPSSRSSACCDPSSACCPTSSAARWWPRSSGSIFCTTAT